MGLLLMKTFNRLARGARDRRAAAPRAGPMLGILPYRCFLLKNNPLLSKSPNRRLSFGST
jgi:hypothetical protein